MRPAPFSYLRPRSVEEALSLLEQEESCTRILAGGQSLVPAMRRRHVRPSRVIDINKVAALEYVNEQEDYVAIGSLVRQETARELKDLPLLCAVLQRSGFSATRARGTVGGAVAEAHPAGDLPLVLVALDGSVVARSARRGERVIEARDFFLGHQQTALRNDELLVEVRLPKRHSCAFAYERATAGVGAWRASIHVAVVIDAADHRVERAAIAVGGAGPKTDRMDKAERLLEDQLTSTEAIYAAAQVASDGCEAVSDNDASEAYIRHLVSVLVRRTLLHAMNR